MHKLEIASTDTSPSANFSKETNQFNISGPSIMDNTVPFYTLIKNWLKEYGKQPNPETNLVVQLDYLNTASSRQLLDIFKVLESMPGAKVTWYFSDEDEDMEEMGQELSELVKVPFQFKTR
jgi:hypothetical protein